MKKRWVVLLVVFAGLLGWFLAPEKIQNGDFILELQHQLGQWKKLERIKAAAAASAIDYTLNSAPLRTDQVLGIDDPAGTWAINRFPISGMLEKIILADFKSVTAWRMLYSNGSGVLTELPFGAAGYLFKSTGTGAAPSWSNSVGLGELILPNDSAETTTKTNVDNEAEVRWAKDTDRLWSNDGSNDIAIASKTQRVFELCIATPVDADHDDIKVKLPFATVITAAYGDGTAGTSTVINCKEVDSDADDSDAVTIDGDWTITSGTQFSDTSFTNAALDANDWLQCDVGTVTGAVTMVCLVLWGYYI